MRKEKLNPAWRPTKWCERYWYVDPLAGVSSGANGDGLAYEERDRTQPFEEWMAQRYNTFPNEKAATYAKAVIDYILKAHARSGKKPKPGQRFWYLMDGFTVCGSAIYQETGETANFSKSLFADGLATCSKKAAERLSNKIYKAVRQWYWYFLLATPPELPRITLGPYLNNYPDYE